MVAISVESIGLFLGCRFAICLLGHFIGTFAILASIAIDIKQHFLNVQIDEQTDELEITRKLVEFIDLHSNAKQLRKTIFQIQFT